MLFIYIQVIIPCNVETVGNCPNTSDSWNAAAQRKNCSANLCGNNTDYRYHCLPTEKSQLAEVCAHSINLVGVCPYYDTVGKSVQRSQISCVSANCKVYRSTNLYKYQDCYVLSLYEELSQGTTEASSSGATGIHNDATRYWIFIFKVLFKVIKWLWLITITLTFCLQSICLIVSCIAAVQGPWIENLYVKCRLYFVGKAACILKSWLMQNYFFVVWYKVRFVSLPSFLLILSNNYRILLMLILTFM